MFHGPNAIERASALPGFQPLRALLKRLSDHRREGVGAMDESRPFEPDFYALDDVACAPIRRR